MVTGRASSAPTVEGRAEALPYRTAGLTRALTAT